MKRVVLHPGKEKSVFRRHPWIFSGAIASLPTIEEGEILPVYSAEGIFLAQGYFHSKNSIAGRLLSFEKTPVRETLISLIRRAVAFRLRHFSSSSLATTGYRLINAEGDGLPGLVVDNYDGTLVMQISTWGMERLRPLIVETLCEVVSPQRIYEKSTSNAREQEGLQEVKGWLFGKPVDEVEILEGGIRFIVSIEEGQKTGFFFDQREMRALVSRHASGKRILNCFAYSGGFSLYALAAGAERVDSVDICAKACTLAKRNTELNGIDSKRHRVIQEDVFSFLQRSSFDYDMIVLDPPAFAKKRGDVMAACRGYKELHRLAFEKMSQGTLIVTSSCSYFVDAPLFQRVVFQAACEAKRNITVIGRHLLAADHPISLYHPEGEYLKSLFLSN